MEGHRITGRKRPARFAQISDLMAPARPPYQPAEKRGLRPDSSNARILAYLRRSRKPRSARDIALAVFGRAKSISVYSALLSLSSRGLINVLDNDVYEAVRRARKGES